MTTPTVAGDLALRLAARARPAGSRGGFLELHAALEGPAWRLERDTLLQEWLRALSGDAPAAPRAAARRDPALRRACELLGDELARNVTLAEVPRRPAWAAIA